MASYAQWKRGFPSGHRMLYVCGEDKALVYDVLKSELSYRPVSALDYSELDGKTTDVQDIMLVLDQFAKNGYRVVVIKNADQIKMWGPIIDWTKDKQMKDTTLICIGNESRPDTKQDRYRAFLDNPQGRYVECRPLDEEHLQAMIVGTGKYTPEAANTLIYRTGGSTASILNEMRKLSYLPSPINVEMVETYVALHEAEQLADALFTNNKPMAMKIISTLDPKKFGYVIGTLEYALTNLVLLSFVHSRQMELRDLEERSGVPLFLLPTYLKWGKGLSTNMLYRRLKLLANADAYNRKGHTTGVLERFCAMW
jgi:DNA polymerase III delta subunit